MRALRIRTKIFLGMVAILAVFAFVSTVVIAHLAARMAERQISDTLRESVKSYQYFSALRGELVASQARSLAQTPLLKAVMNIPQVDHETAYYTARDLYEVIDLDLMLLLSPDGLLLANADSLGHTGQDLRAMPGIDDARRGADSRALWHYDGALYQVGITTIALDEQVLGLLVLGDRIDEAAATEASEATGEDVFVLHRDVLMAQSRDAAAPTTNELAQLAEQLHAPNSNPFRTSLGEKACLAIAVPLANVAGHVVLARDLDKLAGEIDIFEISMLGLGIAAAFVALLFSFWLAARMSSPITELSAAAEQVGTGRFDLRVQVSSDDELGLLANSFNAMVERIAERTHDLQLEIAERKRSETQRLSLEEQLHQSQKLEALGMLAGGVAHDFNNLLTIVIGYSELLEMSTDKEDPDFQTIREIKDAGQRGAALVRQLLAFSRRQVLQPRTLQINELLTNMEKMLRRLIGEDVRLDTHYTESAGWIYTDPGQVEQVVMNLVVNARDAMPNGGRIEIGTDSAQIDGNDPAHPPTARHGAYALLTVRDTGTGINSETLEHIFEPFFTTKSVDKGTGLGLATVYGIVRQSEGHIQVDSELGRGTIFRIYLPQIEAAAAETQQGAIPVKTERGSETVLVAEDEGQVRHLVSHILRQQGYTVIEAENGADALRLSARYASDIDLLLSDVVMPELNGPELARQLVLLRPQLKMIFMSGYTDEAVFERSGLRSEQTLLQKPFAPEVLAAKVREVLDAELS